MNLLRPLVTIQALQQSLSFSQTSGSLSHTFSTSKSWMGTAEAQRASESNRAASIFIGVVLAALEEEEGVRGGRQRESTFYAALLPPHPCLSSPPADPSCASSFLCNFLPSSPFKLSPQPE